MTFELHPNLAKKVFVVDLPLCRVFLEDESHYPWLLLVPRQPDISRIMDLEAQDQLQLLHELDLAQKVLWKSFRLDQINVAAIGNKTPQLHVHVIGRQIDDPAWPQTVWDHPIRRPYSPVAKEEMVLLLRAALEID